MPFANCNWKVWSIACRAWALCRATAPVSSSLVIRDIHEEIVARGHTHHATVHLAREEQAVCRRRNGWASWRARVLHTLIVHYENGVALQ